MKKIELARLYQLTYITANVESYEQFNISFEIQKDKVHESNAYGNASLVSGDIEILFFW